MAFRVYAYIDFSKKGVTYFIFGVAASIFHIFLLSKMFVLIVYKDFYIFQMKFFINYNFLSHSGSPVTILTSTLSDTNLY